MKTAVVLFAAALAAMAQARFLPRGAVARAVASDAAGTVYVAGTQDSRAFVSRDDQVLFTGQANSGIAALTVAGDGSLFAAGGESGSAVVWKLDPHGNVLYRSVIPGPVTPMSIAVNAAGEALVGGVVLYPGDGFVTTPGAAVDHPDWPGFLVKLDRGGAVSAALRGIGNGPVAFDSAGDLYVAGVDWVGSVSATPGAFQANHGWHPCGGSGMLSIPCAYQYVAKVAKDGTKLIYLTFVAGTDGATPAGLSVDADGNALVAGYTNSSDYPVTAGAYQTEYRVTNLVPYVPSPHGFVVPPPTTGYLTKVNRDGTGLVWSTFFSGTGSDTITSMAVDPDGAITVAGLSGSRDLPGGQAVPDNCAPALGVEIPFVARFDPQAQTLLASRYVFGVDPNARPMVTQGPSLITGETVAVVDLQASPGLACTMDSADYARTVRAAPAQLISVLGDELDGAIVTIDGVPAPILYTSREQVNLQVPPQVAGRDVVELAVTTANGISLSRPLRMVPQAPSAFLDIQQADRVSHYIRCDGSTFGPADPPVARNEDGTLNSCRAPALPGSTVTLFLNGLGTGDHIASLRYEQAGTILALEPDPDAPNGVWRLLLRLPRLAITQTVEVLIDGAPLRDAPLAIWMAPN